MKKIILIFIIILSCGWFLYGQKTNAYADVQDTSKANEYCAKGDKILNYYEKLEDKTNASKYLNAAKYYYYQASRVDISNQNSLIGMARVALYKGNTRDAKNALMIALNVNEVNPRVSFYLGEAFFAEGEYFQAIDFYTWAYSHGYRYDYKTNLQLGICYEKLDDTAKAKYHYQNALKARPDSLKAKSRLGGLNTTETYDSNNDEIDMQDIKNLNMPNL